MGLPTEGRDFLRSRYPAAVSYKRPQPGPGVVVYDLMKDVKAIPEDIQTLDGVLFFLTGQVKRYLENRQFPIKVIIVMVDRAPPPVKEIMTRRKRYENMNILSEKEGPHLPVKVTNLIPRPWMSFAGNYKLMQRELYPRLFNAFMDGQHVVPNPGQTIILHGFPGMEEWVPIHNPRAYQGVPEDGENNMRKQIHFWRESSELPLTEERELKDPHLYNRVYVIENVPPSPQWPNGLMRQEEWLEARNDISESDAAMFFYDHWFQNQDILVVCNDGDVFLYEIMYSYERIKAGENVMRNNHILALPFKKKRDEFGVLEAMRERDPSALRYEYWDSNILYGLIQEDEAFMEAGVQNHELTLAFMLLLPGSDFFPKSAFKGMSCTKILWPVFLSCLPMFSHLVQLSKALRPHTRTARTPVLDEDAFREFTHMCYIERHGKGARKTAKRKKGDTGLRKRELKRHCAESKSAQKDPLYQLPDRNTIRMWSRMLEWNILYYKRAPLGNARVHLPNPFEKWHDLPYYPYIIDPDTQEYEVTNVVSAIQKPVDEVYWLNFQRKKQRYLKRGRHLEDEEEASKRRKNIIENL